MTNSQLDNKPLKLYWTISEVSERYNLPQSKIRYWLEYFGLEVKRARNGSRQFTETDVKKVGVILDYCNNGFHLWAIKKLL